jgi:hypothetical protein
MIATPIKSVLLVAVSALSVGTIAFVAQSRWRADQSAPHTGAVAGGDRFKLLSLSDQTLLQVGYVNFGAEDWMLMVRKGIGNWEIMIHRTTDHKNPIYIPIAEETAKELIAEGVSLLYQFTFSRKGYDPSGDEPMHVISLRALSGRERIDVKYSRSATKDRYPELEHFLTRLSELIPDAHPQYRLK